MNQQSPATWGDRPFSELYAAANALRIAIRQEGSPQIQSAWDEVEPFFDIILARPKPQPGGDGTREGAGPGFDRLNDAHARALDELGQGQ